MHAEAEKQSKLFGGISGDPLGLTDFLTCVGQLRFRGTSHLFRSGSSVLQLLQDRLSSTLVQHRGSDSKRSRTSPDFVSLAPLVEESVMDGFVQSDMDDPYEIASHSVRLRKSGTVLDVHTIWDVESKPLHPKI